jgi:hypothetical protein
MNRKLPAALCTVIIILILTAGCTMLSPQKTGANALVTTSSGTGAGSSSTGTNSASSGTCDGAALDIDPANCGYCGAVCPENALCQAGRCFCKDGFKPDNNQCVALPTGSSSNGCPQGMSPCPDKYCYELGVSSSNCGLCSYVCTGSTVCSAGTCISPPVEPATTPSTGTTCDTPGQTKCGSRCVNTTANGANCGSCGKICYSAAPNCCNGGCVNFQKDTSNCGSCGHKCGSGSTCAYGSCRIKVMGTVYSAITVLPSIAK